MSLQSTVPNETRPSTYTLHLFYDLQSGFFVSPNANYLPNIPLPTDRMNSVYEGLRPRFAYDDWFYLSFVPKQVTYDIPMFECLAPLACTLEQVSTDSGRGYRLAEELIKKWSALESITAHIQRKLLRRIAGTYLETLVPPYPSSMGFWRIWNTRPNALLAIRLARTTFTLRFAFLSWLVMKERLKGRDTWTDLASDEHDPIPLSICNSFRASWIADFSIPRIGAFVDIRGTLLPDAGRQWHEDIHGMLDHNIPIWFSYGKNPTPNPLLSLTSNELHKRYMPDKYAVDILESITPRGYSIINARLCHSQPRRETESTDKVLLSEIYGYMPQLKHSPTPPSHAFVRPRQYESIAYGLTFSGGRTTTGEAYEFGPSHTSLEADLLRYRYRQQWGDTYQGFIAREASILEDIIKQETHSERERRVRRVLLNAGQPIPGEKGPAVYAWIVEGEEQIRMRVDTEDIPELWRRTTPSKRTYNPVRDEYDVEDESGITADINLDSISGTEDTTRARSASPTPRPPHAHRTRTPPSTFGDGEDMRRMQQLSPVTIPQDAEALIRELGNALYNIANILINIKTVREEVYQSVEVEEIETVLRDRYGYHVPEEKWQARSNDGREWTHNRKIAKVFRTIGYWDKKRSTERDKMANDQLEPLADFVSIVKQGHSPPNELCDLFPPASPLTCKSVYLGLRIWQHKPQEPNSETQHAHPPAYTVYSLNNQVLKTSSGCFIATDMATNILHLQRADFGTSANEILEAFLHRGMQIRLLRPTTLPIVDKLRRARASTIGNRPLGIGVKPHGIQLGEQDYAAYVRMRTTVLQGPAGCAALLEGGIVWRLARDVCRIEDAAKGPDLDDDASYDNLAVLTLNAQQFVETSLTQQDQYLITGVYRIRQPLDKNKGTTEVAAITSWWPTSEIWATSGYGSGYWSHDAEEWFQNRLERIRNGTAKPMNSNEWRSSLRHNYADSHKFMTAVENLSASKVSLIRV